MSTRSEQSPAAGADRGVSASTLVFLFGDRLIPAMTKRQRLGATPAVAAPASGVLVPLGPLERWVATVALWSLEDEGLIRISVVEEEVGVNRRLRGPVRFYSLSFSRPSYSTSPMPTGLEAVLLGALKPEECTLHQLVVNGGWYDPTSLPINGMIVPAQREALKLGLLRREERSRRPPRCLQWSQSLPDYVGVGDRIAELEESFLRLDDRLAAWSEADKVKWNALMSECSEALRQARPVSAVPMPPT